MLARPILTLPCISLEDYWFSAKWPAQTGRPRLRPGPLFVQPSQLAASFVFSTYNVAYWPERTFRDYGLLSGIYYLVGERQSCPKNGDIPNSPLPTIGSLVPSVGTIPTPKIEPRLALVPSAPASVAARAAYGARPSNRKAKSHASSFNSARRVTDSSPTRNRYRRRRVDGHRVFLGRLDDWRHRHQTCG